MFAVLINNSYKNHNAIQLYIIYHDYLTMPLTSCVCCFNKIKIIMQFNYRMTGGGGGLQEKTNFHEFRVSVAIRECFLRENLFSSN